MFDILVTVVGVAMGLCPILQIIRICKRRHSADVSVPMFAVISLGALLWFGYGIEHHLLSVIIANSVGTIMNLGAVTVALRYRRQV